MSSKNIAKVEKELFEETSSDAADIFAYWVTVFSVFTSKNESVK